MLYFSITTGKTTLLEIRATISKVHYSSISTSHGIINPLPARQSDSQTPAGVGERSGASDSDWSSQCSDVAHRRGAELYDARGMAIFFLLIPSGISNGEQGNIHIAVLDIPRRELIPPLQSCIHA